MRIVWMEKAEKQLDQIFEYIASDATLNAHRTVGQIIEQAKIFLLILEKVAKFPNMKETTFGKFFIIPIASSDCEKMKQLKYSV